MPLLDDPSPRIKKDNPMAMVLHSKSGPYAYTMSTAASKAAGSIGEYIDVASEPTTTGDSRIPATPGSQQSIPKTPEKKSDLPEVKPPVTIEVIPQVPDVYPKVGERRTSLYAKAVPPREEMPLVDVLDDMQLIRVYQHHARWRRRTIQFFAEKSVSAVRL